MKRIGKFYVTKELFESPPPELAKFLNEIHVYVLNHENGYGGDKYSLVAEFEEFDLIEDGEEIPEYRIMWERQSDGTTRRLPVERIYDVKGPIFDYGAFDRGGSF
jgi:hypothetical protein